MFVKRGELTGNGLIGSFAPIGRFRNLREVKDYARAYCRLRGTRCLYLCQSFAYLDEAPTLVLVLDRQDGKISLKEEVLDQSDRQRDLEDIVGRFVGSALAAGAWI